MNDIVIHQTNPEPFEKEGSSLVEQANQAVIENNDDYQLAGNVIANLDLAIKKITYEFNGSEENPGSVTLAHRAWKAGVALRERALKGVTDAKAIWTSKKRKFEYDVEQRRQEEVRKAAEKARKEAEAVRAKEIAEAKKLGDKEAAAALKQAPLNVVAEAPRTAEVPKVEGMRRSSPIWSWEYTDRNLIPQELLIPDEKEITARVKRGGPQTRIPGIAVFDARSRGV